MLVCAVAAPAGASSGVPDADPPAWVARAGVEGTGQEGLQPQDQPGGKKKQSEKGLRLVWDDRPSLRAGRWLRVDFRVKSQVDARWSQADLADLGEMVEPGVLRGGVEGELLGLFEFQVEHDLRSEGAWRDVYVNFRPLGAAQVQVGKYKVPFGLDKTTGATSLDFVHRSLAANDLAPGRDVGVMVHGSLLKRSVRYEVGYFRGDGDSPPALEPMPYPLPEDESPVKQPSQAARIRVAPFRALGGDSLFGTFEVGVAATSTTIPVGPNHLQGHSVLGADFFPRRYYANGPRRRLGGEFSWSPGPASIKMEYIRTTEARLGQGVGGEGSLDNDLPELVGRGWYVSATWVVTGEKKDGGVVPRNELFGGGIGAVEIAGRYETLRFGSADETEPPSASPRAVTVAASEDTVLTVGLNWYLNRWLKVQANVIRERFTDPARSPIPGQAAVRSVVLRIQFVL